MVHLKHILLTVAVVLIVYFASIARASSNEEDDDDKETPKQLERRTEIMKLPRVDGVISIKSASSFKAYIHGRARSYDVVVLFSATVKTGCRACPEWEEAYATVAKAYEETLGKDKSKRMFFFIKVKYDDDPDMFRMYGMNHAPQMIYIPSEAKAPDSKFDPAKTYNQFILQLAHQEYVLPETIIEFIKSRAGVNVEIYQSPWYKIVNLIVFVVLGAFVFQYLALAIIPRLRRNRWGWFLFSCVAFGLGASGTIYAYLKNSPNFGYDSKSRKYTYFAGDRNQYTYEGYIVASLLISSGLSLIIAANVNFKGQFKKLNSLISLFFLLLFIGLFRVYLLLYTGKARWYAHGMVSASPISGIWFPQNI